MLWRRRRGDQLGNDGRPAATPDAAQDVQRRLDLAALRLSEGRPAEALAHYAAALARDPTSLTAMRGAATASAALGDEQRAAGYARLATALSQGADAETPTPGVGRGPRRRWPRGRHTFLPRPSASPAYPADLALPDCRSKALEQATTGEFARPLAAADAVIAAGRPRVTLADVAGMDAVKRRLRLSFLAPMQRDDLRRAYGRSLHGGLLLYGPPGCGKTFIAHALAGELGARFISVGLSDVLDMWLGESERRLHEIFASARRSPPAVLFFDEVDALGQKRAHLTHSGGRNIVNQLLAELDGVGADNTGLFVLGATNHPWDVDTALLRPGRFDRLALVTPPDEPARAAILAHHLLGRPVEGVDHARIATRTNGFSGADLARLCDAAVEFALEASLDGGALRPIRDRDFTQALREARPSTGPWFEVARNFATFGNDSGLYDELVAYMKAVKLL